MCIKSIALKQRELTGCNHIITSEIEHKALLNSCHYLESLGFEVTYIKPMPDGIINPEDIEAVITDNTCLISIMYVNNILGTIQPIEQISELCIKHNILFHVDMVQALGNIDINLDALCVDAATFSGHKIHGPKIGFVYINKAVPFDSFVDGGGQENGKRAGTENLPYILGVAKAVQLATKNIELKQKKIAKMRDYLLEECKKIFTESCIEYRVNGSFENRIANNLHICFKDITGETLVYLLGQNYNVNISEGSACNTGNLETDYVLNAIGVPEDYLNGPIRITLNEYNTMKECKRFIKYFKKELIDCM